MLTLSLDYDILIDICILTIIIRKVTILFPQFILLEKVGKTLAINKDVDLPAILKEGSEAGIEININIL